MTKTHDWFIPDIYCMYRKGLYNTDCGRYDNKKGKCEYENCPLRKKEDK